MARFTMYVRDVCDMLNYRNQGKVYYDYAENIKNAIPYIFKDFPLFDESHREELCTKILKHYYMREIGMETYEAWLLKLDERMNLIMPRYNEEYKTLALDYDILQDVNVTTTGNSSTNSNGETTSNQKIEETITGNSEITGETTSNSLLSDTPQMNYANVDYATELTENNENRSENTTNNQSSTNNQQMTGNTKDTSTTENSVTVKGINGHTNMSMINEYRQNIINVDEKIVNALSDLFMTVFGTW